MRHEKTKQPQDLQFHYLAKGSHCDQCTTILVGASQSLHEEKIVVDAVCAVFSRSIGWCSRMPQTSMDIGSSPDFANQGPPRVNKVDTGYSGHGGYIKGVVEKSRNRSA